MKIPTLEQRRRYERYVLDLANSLKPQIVFILIIFIIGLTFGLFNTINSDEFVVEALKKLLAKFSEHRGIALFIHIFIQNARAAGIIICTGIFLSITPTLSSFMNGLVIGHFIEKAVHTHFAFESIIGLVPHGIFEIPALIFALGLGVKFGAWPLSNNKKEMIKSNVIAFSKYYLWVIVPLLLVAALIETIGIETQYLLELR